jgi:hypothetical protein
VTNFNSIKSIVTSLALMQSISDILESFIMMGCCFAYSVIVKSKRVIPSGRAWEEVKVVTNYGSGVWVPWTTLRSLVSLFIVDILTSGRSFSSVRCAIWLHSIASFDVTAVGSWTDRAQWQAYIQYMHKAYACSANWFLLGTSRLIFEPNPTKMFRLICIGVGCSSLIKEPVWRRKWKRWSRVGSSRDERLILRPAFSFSAQATK